MKKIICIDLDGVLNVYTGNYNKHLIPPIRTGAFQFIKKLSKDFRIVIFSVRDIKLIKDWLVENDLITYVYDISNEKTPYATVFLDDRAINFNGDYDAAYNMIINFKPYWQ